MNAAGWMFTATAVPCGAFIAWAAPRVYRDLRDVYRSRQPLPPWQPAVAETIREPAPSPAHDAIPLSDDEEYVFAETVLDYFQREDAT